MATEIGYYLPELNWSVRQHSGQWCMFARQPGDAVASTPQQIAAINEWRSINIAKHHGNAGRDRY